VADKKLSKRLRQNPVLNIIRQIVYLSNVSQLNTFSNKNTYLDFVSSLETILGTWNRARVAEYFVVNGAATAAVLMHRLGLRYATTYRILRDFSNVGFIRPVSTVRGERGREAVVWAVPGANPERVREAVLEHRRLSSPVYRAAEPFIREFAGRPGRDVSYREILRRCGRVDVAEVVAHELQRVAKKRVWR